MSTPRTPDAPGSTGSPTFPLFAEMLLIGVVVALVSVPVVTALPAVAAGVRHLRRHLDGENDGWRTLLADLGLAIRRLWLPGLALLVLMLVLAFNLWLAAAAALPGGAAVTVVSVVVAAAALVVALRLAGTWSLGTPLPTQLRAAALRARRDLTGSALIIAALVGSAVLVWMLLPIALLVGGLLAFAALSVETRWAGRTTADDATRTGPERNP